MGGRDDDRGPVVEHDLRVAGNLKDYARPKPGEVTIRAVSSDTLFTFGRDTLRAFAVPGHSPGSMVYLLRETLFVGDAANWSALRGFRGDVPYVRRTRGVRQKRHRGFHHVGMSRQRALSRFLRYVRRDPGRAMCANADDLGRNAVSFVSPSDQSPMQSRPTTSRFVLPAAGVPRQAPSSHFVAAATPVVDPLPELLIAHLAKLSIRVNAQSVRRVLSNPLGVECSYPDMLGLRSTLNASAAFRVDNHGRGPSDDWRTSGISILVGYSEVSGQRPLHIDIPENGAAFFRAYFLSSQQSTIAEAEQRAKILQNDGNGVYRTIANRMAWKDPQFDLDTHVAEIIRVGRTTLDGIDFVPRDARKLGLALQAMRSGSRRRFAWPQKDTVVDGGRDFFTGTGVSGNTTFDVSLAATHGAGYREVLSASSMTAAMSPPTAVTESAMERAMSFRGPKFSGAFSDYIARPDISALHCAVSPSLCNIHVDQTAVVVYDESGRLLVWGNAGQHTGEELLWKTYGPGILNLLLGKMPVLHFLPLKRIPEVIDLRFPSPANGYTNFSAEAFLVRKKTLTVSLKYSCAPAALQEVTGQDFFRRVPGITPEQKDTDHSVTFNISGTHNLLGGR
jgi:hypothetical protein